ncbi:MAG TPA: hypothetical protein DIC45_08345 [Comamonadaceae bacterium]|uniref:hypothetical protein n=1 Tax=Pulveribacter sp. TaxID=2678893 RepID=UPI000ED337B3|nr:hypothetical protein [Pulveribacter sp.]HCL86491.1 hypothetical protein [Comamonadaceae bacterium]
MSSERHSHARPAGTQAAKPFGLRTWSTPVTMGSFLLMSATGVLMFFDIVPGYLSFAHEWFSWLFLLGAGGHAVVHLRPLAKHLKTHWGRASVALCSAALAVSMFSFGRITAPQLKWPIAEALVDAPLHVLADLTRTDRATLLARLQAHGIAATADQSIKQLAAAQAVDEFHVLGLVILRK